MQPAAAKATKANPALITSRRWGAMKMRHMTARAIRNDVVVSVRKLRSAKSWAGNREQSSAQSIASFFSVKSRTMAKTITVVPTPKTSWNQSTEAASGLPNVPSVHTR